MNRLNFHIRLVAVLRLDVVLTGNSDGLEMKQSIVTIKFQPALPAKTKTYSLPAYQTL
jgi:hypothetical protein